MRKPSFLYPRQLVCIVMLAIFTAASTHAEVIRIPIGEQNAAVASVSRPQKGLSKSTVMDQFGEPAKRHAAVGNPPIERWDYPSFTVYFEYDHVVHSVLSGPKLTH